MGYIFSGINIEKPGVYTTTDTSAMIVPNSAATGIIAAIGPAQGGVPNKVYHFNSLREAKETLKAGTLYDCISFMYNPTGNGGGAGEIIAIRVAGSGYQQASVILKDSDNKDVLRLKAKDYSSIGNYIKVFVADGTEAGKKIILRDYYTPNEEVFDNLGPAFSIKYGGEEDDAKLSITVADGISTLLTVNAGEDSFSIDLTQENFNTIGKVVTYLNSLPYITSTVSPYLVSGDLPSAYLDAVNEQDIKTTTYICTANLGSIIYAINNSSTMVTAEKASPTVVNAPKNTTEFVSLSGGSDGGSPTASDYDTALGYLEAEDCDIIYVASGSSDVQAKVMSHVNEMSSILGRKERIAVFGLDNIDADADDYVSKAVSFNSERAIVCAPGIVKNINGTPNSYPSYYTAALIAGLIAGTGITENITFKTIGVDGLTKYFTPSEITKLLQGGVCAIEYDRRHGFRVVRGLTTYLTSNNLAKKEINAVRVIDALARDLREYLENRFIGRSMTPNIEETIRSAVITVLNQYVLNGGLVGGKYPAYRNINVAVNNGVITVSFEASPVLPLNYIFIKQVFSPAYDWTSSVTV